MRVSNFPHYSYLNVVDNDIKFSINNEYDNKYTNIGLGGSKSEYYVDENKIYNIGILIDMNKKKCIFYDYDKQDKIRCKQDATISTYIDDKYATISYLKGEPLEGNILSDNVKLIAWIKNDATEENTGITILNEGCISVPDWVKY